MEPGVIWCPNSCANRGFLQLNSTKVPARVRAVAGRWIAVAVAFTFVAPLAADVKQQRRVESARWVYEAVFNNPSRTLPESSSPVAMSPSNAQAVWDAVLGPRPFCVASS